MDEHTLKKLQLEAILFAMGGSVEEADLSRALELTVPETEALAEALQREYDENRRGMQIIRLENAYQMCTRKDYYDTLIRIASIPKRAVLTDVLLETLSIIAYKQPVTKLEIEKIRGVKSDHAVNRLVEYELVTEVGRMDAPGRPILFGTTENFLRHFGISSLDELPKVDPLREDHFKKEAEQEVDRKMGI